MKYLENSFRGDPNVLRREFSLATSIAVAITLLVIASTLTISGFLYNSLNRSLTAEFEERVKAESREVSQALTNRYKHVETKLQGLVLDNTLRVTLMLGAHNQLKEHLQTAYSHEPDIHFFLQDIKTKTHAISSDIEFARHEIWQALSSPAGKLELTNDMSGIGFKLTYVLPIVRQQDSIGLAAAVYFFSKDTLLKSITGHNKFSKLAIIDEGYAWDLFTGTTVQMPLSFLTARKAVHTVNYFTAQSERFAAVTGDKFPDLLFIVSLKELEEEKRQVLLSVLTPALLVILISLLLSIILSRQLAKPLKRLSTLAIGIAHGETDFHFYDKKSRILEFNKLKTSFEAMLHHLQHAREMERYQELFEGVADIVLIHDTEGHMIDVNEVASERLGLDKTELARKTLIDIVPDHSFPRLLKTIKELETNNKQIVFTTEFIDNSGNNMNVECHARLIMYNSMEVVLNVVRDISDRKRAEIALLKSHQTLLTVLDSIRATIYVCDINNHQILFMNSHMKEVIGEDAVGKKCMEAHQYLATSCKHCKADGPDDCTITAVETTPWEGRNPLNDKWYMHYDRLINWVNGRLVKFQIAFDMTDIKALAEKKDNVERQLRKIQKMEAIGTLAGGVAHDLNNILSGIVSYPDILLMQVPEDSPLRGPLQTIKDSGLKASATVNDLLTLARRSVLIHKVIDINEVVTGYLESPEHAGLMKDHQNVVVEVNFQTDILNILGSPVHLTKTVMNLVANGVEAIQGKGTVVITTAVLQVDGPVPGNPKIEEGEYVVLSISDDGCGISPEDIERIFEPFFTTKVMGRSGTGLGMAVVWGTVEDHEGYIELDSTLGEGTTFRLYFPVTRSELLKEQAVLSQESYRGTGETILVVDDIREQREIASLMFSQLGYRVVTASSGEEAAAYLADHNVDLVILDMIMEGGMNGLETYKKIIEIHPAQKAILTTGYSKTADVNKALKLGAGQYVKKPFLFDEIAQAVWSEIHKEQLDPDRHPN